MELESMLGIALLIGLVLWGIYNRVTGGPVKVEGISALPNQVRQWVGMAQQWSKLYGIPWQITVAVIWQESGGDPNARGDAGEIGLMQLKEIAVRDLVRQGYDTATDWKVVPEANIKNGVAYLHLQRTRTGTLVDAVGRKKADALEAYNEGFSQAVKDVSVDSYTTAVLEKAKKLGY